MKVIFAIFVAIVGIFANVSADGKEDGNLLKVLAAERKETNEMFKRENQRLRQDDDQLHGKVDKLYGKLDTLHGKLDKLQGQNKKLQKKNKNLEKEIIKLRGADSEIQASIRQKDQLQNGTRLALDLDDHLKKVINSEIIKFLTREKICISGTLTEGAKPNDKWVDHTIQFGYTFPREPTVSASIAEAYDTGKGEKNFDARTKVKSTSNSTAVISTYQNYQTEFASVSWIACL